MIATEITVLVLATLLQVVQLILMAVPANLELGVGKTLSPRDEARLGGSLLSQVSVRTGRLMRALNNHFEALLLFAIAVIAVTITDNSTPLTVVCSWAYLGARILYVPAYVFAWVPWRSMIWMVGLTATVIMLLSVLF
ncbi:MAPEG family protein [Granulosicoccus sp.]|jgi:uncharacterized MAPEG superfamily protein|nr:MAPEG family protein [Granulosicoccus sp.]MDB4222716.1 MAPEG family protein [Granulosicoccus sp.]